MKGNKGFAISAIIYSFIVLFLMLMLLTLIMLSSRKVILDKQKTDALNSINGISDTTLTYKETILNGAYPELYDGLIPVIISDDGVTQKADITKMWYSYENKVWANAVILFDEDTYEVGDIIEESKIKQYYVWIPRYRYELWNVESDSLYPNQSDGPTAINIVFENKNSAVSNGTQNGEWLTHPAFVSFNTNGLWIGKFETSYNESTFTDSTTFLTSNTNTSLATDASNIIIKPNMRNLTNKSVSEFYTLSREVNSSLNSHMMKNTEWGAVAYLTYSEYGKCDNGTCEEVYINNINTGYYGETVSFDGQWEYGTTITGCSAKSASEEVNSNSSKCESGYEWNGLYNKASTTGNISGIYDMSGGNWEYMMAVIADSDGNPLSGRNSLYNSGFNGTFDCPTCDDDISGLTQLTTGINFPTDIRYYDLYETNSSILGDSTKEISYLESSSSNTYIGLWYDDYSYYINMSFPWFLRGGTNWDDTLGAGIFGFSYNYGCAKSNYSSRIVLAPI